MAGAEHLAAAVRDAEEVVAEIRFKNRREIADGRIEHRRFKFGDELPTVDVRVATAFVLAAGVFRVAGCGQGHAEGAGRNAGAYRVEEIADIRLLGFGDSWLEDEFAVAHRLGDEGEAVGRCLREELLHFSGRGAHLLVDLGLHASGQQLFHDRVLEFGFPLAHALAVFGFKRLHAAKHLDIVGEAPVDFVHDFGLGHFQTVQFGMVHQEFLEDQLFEQIASLHLGEFAGLTALGQLRPHGKSLRLHLAFQHNSIPHHRNNGVDGCGFHIRLSKGCRPRCEHQNKEEEEWGQSAHGEAHIRNEGKGWTGSTRHNKCTTNRSFSVEFFHVSIGPRLDDQLLFHGEEQFLLAPMQNHVDHLVAHG